MSTRKLTEAERQWRLAQAMQRLDFITGRAPARRLKKPEREERQRLHKLELEGLKRQVAADADLARRKKLGPSNMGRKRLGPSNMTLEEMSYLAVDPGSLAWNFFGRRMNELIQGGSGINEAWEQAFVDLIRSDVPIDARLLRDILEDVLARSFWPERKKQRKLDKAQWYQDYFENVAGMTPGDAEQAAADSISLSVDALRQRRRRDRMPKKQYRKQKQGPR